MTVLCESPRDGMSDATGVSGDSMSLRMSGSEDAVSVSMDAYVPGLITPKHFSINYQPAPPPTL